MTTFTLSALNSDFTTQGFQLNDISSVAETINFDFTVPVTMDKTEFNSVFYLAPEAPGLADLSRLANIDAFGNEEILYLTKKDNFASAITGLTTAAATRKDTAADNVTLDANDQAIDETSIKVWSKNIFAGQQDLDDIWTTASRDQVKSEMNTFMSKEDGLDDSSVVTLLKSLKDKIHAANGLDNTEANKTTTNLTRQLVLQLHEQIYDSNLDADGDSNTAGEKAYRLTNAAGGIFRNGQEETINVDGVDHVFYPFEFEAGDKLEFGLKFTHPESSYASGAFEGAYPLPEILLKVVVTMQ